MGGDKRYGSVELDRDAKARCPICGVFVSSLARHKRRGRCSQQHIHVPKGVHHAHRHAERLSSFQKLLERVLHKPKGGFV